MKPSIQIRLAEEGDEKYLIEWLSQPGVLEGFPLTDSREIEDAARIWMGFCKIKAGLTAVHEGVPCATAVLYIQPYKKLAHQCLFAIIVDEKFRGQGIGHELITELMRLGKNAFHLKLLHLEVYEKNPAVRLYERLGFKRYGFQPHFVKDQGHYIGKILMQKKL